MPSNRNRGPRADNEAHDALLQDWTDKDADTLPYTSSTEPRLEYGPLTAQGNYISSMDWPQIPTLAAPPPGELGCDFTGQTYRIDSNGTQPGSSFWMTSENPSIVDTSYDLYGQMLNGTYQGTEFIDNPFHQIESPPLLDLTSSIVPQNTYSPYNGIWAFNPLAVDDNFVYPTEVAPFTMSKTDAAALPIDTVISAPGVNLAMTAKDPAANFAASSSTMSGAFAAPISVSASTPHVIRTTPIGSKSSKLSLAPPDKSSRPERTKRNRAGQASAVVPRRQGPLSSAQRQKADDMRYYGACWRCRRYKKPCNGPGTCDTCLTSGFRVWPSTIGCYRGNMEDFIIGVMPGNAEQVINGMNFDFKKVPNWKTLFGYRQDIRPIAYSTSSKDKYEALSIKLQATRMAGRGFVELLDVLANYQRSRTKPDTCLELACSALNHICDIYHAFVETDTPIRLDAVELLSALTRFRTAYSDNWRQFLQLCLSGRRSAWFPAFLCACINVPLLVVLKDGFVAIPEPARTTLWPNISFLIEDLRNRLYPMGLDLLSALAKGIKPWKLRCWGWKERVEADGSLTLERDLDGMRLLAGDVGAFDGFAAVQSWLTRHRVDMLDGVSFLTTPPFSERNAKMQPIAALAWIFEVNPPKEDREKGLDSERPVAIAGAA